MSLECLAAIRAGGRRLCPARVFLQVVGAASWGDDNRQLLTSRMPTPRCNKPLAVVWHRANADTGKTLIPG